MTDHDWGYKPAAYVLKPLSLGTGSERTTKKPADIVTFLSDDVVVPRQRLPIPGDGVGLAGSIAAGDEVAGFVVAREEGKQMIEDLCLLRLGCPHPIQRSQPALVLLQKLLGQACLKRRVLALRFTPFRKRVLRHLAPNSGAEVCHISLQRRPFLVADSLGCLAHPTGKLLTKERLDLVPLDPEKPVDSEIEVGCVQLKEIAKERLQILKCAHGSPSSKPYDPTSPGWLAFNHSWTISRNVPTASTSSSTSISDVLPTRS